MNRKSFLTLLAGLIAAPFLPKKKTNPAWVTIPYDNQEFHWNTPIYGIDPAIGEDETVMVHYMMEPSYVRLKGVYPIPPKKS